MQLRVGAVYAGEQSWSSHLGRQPVSGLSNHCGFDFSRTDIELDWHTDRRVHALDWARVNFKPKLDWVCGIDRCNEERRNQSQCDAVSE